MLQHSVKLDHICKSVSYSETMCQDNYSGKLKKTSTVFKARRLVSVQKYPSRTFFSSEHAPESLTHKKKKPILTHFVIALENNLIGHPKFPLFLLERDTTMAALLSPHCSPFLSTCCHVVLSLYVILNVILTLEA